jgi:DNA-binding response OmpR family regulator
MKKSLDLDHVKSLEKAVEYLQVSQPSVIILDNKLPDGFGINLLTYVKKMYPQIKIIMISGMVLKLKDAAIESGADDFIEKPFTRNQLLHSLELSMS